MKKFLSYLPLSAAALVALSFAACTDSDVVADGSNLVTGNPAENVVQFDTYMGGSKMETRAGKPGSIDTEVLKKDGYGFGVFAYYTKTESYQNYRTQDGTAGRYPNFMYNEKIVFSSSDNKWVYADVKNTKYWPNEVQNGAVDDQNNNTANDPAKTDYTNGGNVSFFAYAPYAAEGVTPTLGIDGQPVSTSDNEGTTSGIVAFSSNNFNGGKSTATDNTKNRFSDPYVKYTISAANDKQVDLLWGTANNSSENVINETTQAGMAAKDLPDYNGTTLIAEANRETWNVNTDLTKQKTTGTVKFLFKHALAKIGGSYRQIGSYTDGSDDNASSPTNGLMVVLDIDKDDNESGGSLQAYSGTVTAQTKYNTKVTINSIVIESGKQLTEEGVTALTNNTDITETYFENLISTGILNLATGVWSDLEKPTTTITRTQTIQSSGSTFGGDTDDSKKDAVLHANIAEPATFTTTEYTRERFEELPIGVTTVPKNVYGSEAQPFVFIPGSKPIIQITIDYTVRTFDAKLANKYSEVRQKITKRLYILDEIKMNKQYSILMRLGLTSVKLEATVSDWDVDTKENVSGKTDGTSATSDVLTFDQTVEHVYLPINVSELKTVTTTVSTNAPGSQAGTEIQLDNLSLTYSDAKDNLTNVSKDDFAKQRITFSTTSTGASVNANTGLVTFTENASESTKTVEIYIHRGNQTAGPITLTQPAPTLDAITLTVASTTVPATGGTITPTVTASFKNTDNSPNSYSPNITTRTGVTYQVNDADATLSEGGTLSVGAGTAGQAIKVKASYSGKVSEINSAETLKYVDTPAKRR